jgi:hypothetical protein
MRQEKGGVPIIIMTAFPMKRRDALPPHILAALMY